MSAERQVPGGPFVNETTATQEQIPAGPMLVEGSAGGTGGAGSPTAAMYFLAS